MPKAVKQPPRLKVLKDDPPLELVLVDPTSLDDNPDNWRKHPQRQREAYNALHSAVGYAGAGLYNKRTRRLLDGHMRKDEAIKAGKPFPILVGDWSEEQEKLILAQLDPLGALAETNAAALSNLTEFTKAGMAKLQVPLTTQKALHKLNTDLAELSARIESGDSPSVLLESVKKKRSNLTEAHNSDSFSPEKGVRNGDLVEDIIFPIENEFGIPTLKPSRLCRVIPRQTWDRSDKTAKADSWYCQSAGSSTFPAPTVRNGGILGFFCEDWRFEVAWNDTADFTQRLLTQEWSGIALPDYSTWTDWPLIVCLHNIYRSRWLGRYWQEAGLSVLPILQTCGASDPLTELCLQSLPKKIPVAAIQCRTNDGTTGYWRQFTNFLALCHRTLKIDCVVIYGGSEHWKHFSARLPKGIEYVPLPSFVAQRRGR